MNEAEREAMVSKAAERVLTNLDNMTGINRQGYMRQLVRMLDDTHLTALNFAVEMSPTEKERREYLEEVARRRNMERGNNEE